MRTKQVHGLRSDGFALPRDVMEAVFQAGGEPLMLIPGPAGEPRHRLGRCAAALLPGGTLLADAVGSGSIVVSSCHHQAVDRLGGGLAVSAVSPDGVVEAVEFKDRRPVLAVQRHPEDTVDRHAHALFGWLVAAAAPDQRFRGAWPQLPTFRGAASREGAGQRLVDGWGQAPPAHKPLTSPFAVEVGQKRGRSGSGPGGWLEGIVPRR
ncbi:MAG: gamma-glutamyl-gamma-aminobutyrate hydrolase family protein [Bifidobacteriaceae bacterium]|nr:gamma-glutamyl-gamma-aminobutyrate hydrolase family protein [Bifidobacteriaceae bacterium]